MLRATWKSLLARKLRLFMSAFADHARRGVRGRVAGLHRHPGQGLHRHHGRTRSATSSCARPAASATTRRRARPRPCPRSLVADAGPGRRRGAGRRQRHELRPPSSSASNGKVIGGQGAPGLGLNYSDAPTAGRRPHGPRRTGRPRRRARGRGRPRRRHRRARPATGSATTVHAGDRGHPAHRDRDAGGPGRVRQRRHSWARRLASSTPGTAQQLFVGGKDEFTDVWVDRRAGHVTRPSCATGRAEAAARRVRGRHRRRGGRRGRSSEVNKALSLHQHLPAGLRRRSRWSSGSFLIVNTFSILVAQRSRELALFRALGVEPPAGDPVGALRGVVVGLVGSTVGLGLGFLLALGIKALFATFGLDLTGSRWSSSPPRPWSRMPSGSS